MRGLNPTLIGLISPFPVTHSELVSLPEGRGGRLPEDHTEPSSPPSRTFRSSFSTRFRRGGNALRIW